MPSLPPALQREAARRGVTEACRLQVSALQALRRLRPKRRVRSYKRLDAILEALRFRQGLELLQRVVLDLADALARDTERPTDLLERAGLLAEQAEAELDHLALARRQGVERPFDVLTPQLHLRGVVRRLRR